MPNPNVHHNVVMKITTYDAKPDPRYMLIPYWVSGDIIGTGRIFPEPAKVHYFKFDREGMVYVLGTYFIIINAIQCPHWFSAAPEIFAILAKMTAYIAQIAAFCATGSIIAEWAQGKKRI